MLPLLYKQASDGFRKKVRKTFAILDFVMVRQKGSHVFYRHAHGRYTTIPHHPGSDISRPLLRTILKEINLGIEDFIEINNKI